jgi:hypothetical protein
MNSGNILFQNMNFTNLTLDGCIYVVFFSYLDLVNTATADGLRIVNSSVSTTNFYCAFVGRTQSNTMLFIKNSVIAMNFSGVWYSGVFVGLCGVNRNHMISNVTFTARNQNPVGVKFHILGFKDNAAMGFSGYNDSFTINTTTVTVDGLSSQTVRCFTVPNYTGSLSAYVTLSPGQAAICDTNTDSSDIV